MTKEQYKEYLRSPHWRNLRHRARRNGTQQCYACRRRGVKFDLHHRTYERLGHEHLSDLVWLCRRCHHHVHCLVIEDPELDLWRATYLVRRYVRRVDVCLTSAFSKQKRLKKLGYKIKPGQDIRALAKEVLG